MAGGRGRRRRDGGEADAERRRRGEEVLAGLGRAGSELFLSSEALRWDRHGRSPFAARLRVDRDDLGGEVVGDDADAVAGERRPDVCVLQDVRLREARRHPLGRERERAELRVVSSSRRPRSRRRDRRSALAVRSTARSSPHGSAHEVAAELRAVSALGWRRTPSSPRNRLRRDLRLLQLLELQIVGEVDDRRALRRLVHALRASCRRPSSRIDSGTPVEPTFAVTLEKSAVEVGVELHAEEARGVLDEAPGRRAPGR